MYYGYFYFFSLCAVTVTGRVATKLEDHVSNLIDLKKLLDNKPGNSNYSNVREHHENTHNLLFPSQSIHSTSTEGTKISDSKLNDDLLVVNDLNNTITVADDNRKLTEIPEVKVDNGTVLLLTEYLKAGRQKEAKLASKVDPSIFLGIKSYSGYFTVNETYNSNIFFWYFPVLNKSVSDSPWIIWLQGGPGASSMVGLFDEIGPFTVVKDRLKLNPYTWLTNHSLVFIDNPVGTGFSFTDNVHGYVTDMATYGAHLYSTLNQFLQVFPELKTAPLFIAGESYAGKYIPAMAMEIHKRNQKKEKTDINLKGLMMGNAYVDPDMISHTVWPFYNFGLLDKEQVELVKPLMDSFQNAIKENRSVDAKNIWNRLITLLLFLSNQKHAYNFLVDDVLAGNFVAFLKTTEVKRALHVGDIKFDFVNSTVNALLAPDFLSTAKPQFERLLEHYRVLAYCGQLDQMLPCVFTSENYRTWRWNGTEEFIKANRFPYIYENRLAGYHKTGGNFTEVVIRGAGHMVPADVPAPIQNLITKWTHEIPLNRNYGELTGFDLQRYINYYIKPYPENYL